MIKEDKKNLPKNLISVIRPDADFAKRTKARFLAAYDVHFKTGPRRSNVGYFTFFVKALTAFLIVAAGTLGLSVYADTTNVPADSALYPLKRLSEDVRITFAPPTEKADIQATFAARRAAEIDDLAVRTPTSTDFVVLAKDLDSEVSSSITTADNEDSSGRSVFCSRLLTIFSTSSPAVEQEFSLHPHILQRINDRCNGHGDSSNNKNDGQNESTTLTSTSTISIPAHTPRTGHSEDNEGEKGTIVPSTQVQITATSSGTSSEGSGSDDHSGFRGEDESSGSASNSGSGEAPKIEVHVDASSSVQLPLSVKIGL